MVRFVKIGTKWVNTAFVREFQFRGAFLHVDYETGESAMFEVLSPEYSEELLTGTRFITQVIPCDTPLWQVWRGEKDGTFLAVRVHYLGLCGDGAIYPLVSVDGNFVPELNGLGLFFEGELGQFEPLERRDPADPEAEITACEPRL